MTGRGRGAVLVVVLLVYGTACFVVSLAIARAFGGGAQILFMPVAAIGGAVVGSLAMEWSR